MGFLPSFLAPFMTPLRQRLIDDLRIRNYAPRTVTTYVVAVAGFAQHFQHSPDQLHAQHVRQYQLHLLQQHASWSRFNQPVAALRFLYAVPQPTYRLQLQTAYAVGFRVRHYGLLSNRGRAAKLATCRRLLGVAVRLSVVEAVCAVVPPRCCGVCGEGLMVLVRLLPRAARGGVVSVVAEDSL
jgi:hypothetical protein